ncbi:translation initiation factor IF-2 [Elstera sp.]|jgi:translation initiation factor IF-2|uniref:translation initiation factor IF-2 n=1 Tax=Elstera sp. TaxID=1916664 RepID=UPI0037C1A8D6
MTNENEQSGKKPLTLSRGKLELKKPVETQQVRQSFSHGRSKTVQVEVKKKRVSTDAPADAPAAPAPVVAAPAQPVASPVAAALSATPPAPPPLKPVAAPVVSEAPAPVVEAPAAVAPAPIAEAPVEIAPVEVAPAPVAPAPAPVAAAPAVEIPVVPVKAGPATGTVPLGTASRAPVAGAAVAPAPAAPVAQAPRVATPSADSAPDRMGGRGGRVVTQPPRVAPPPQQRPGGGGGGNQAASGGNRRPQALRTLTEEERAHRLRVLQEAQKRAEEDAKRAAEDAARKAIEDAARKIREAEEAVIRAAEDEIRKKREAEEAVVKAEQDARRKVEQEEAAKRAAANPAPGGVVRENASNRVAIPTVLPTGRVEEEDDAAGRARRGGGGGGGGGGAPGGAKRPPAPPPRRTTTDDRRRGGKITVNQALDSGDQSRMRSMASMRRAREKERLRMLQRQQDKVLREVIIPDAITVQELASRMAERGGEVIKALMRMGVMATINQTIDSDTAELIVQEFGHTPKRASDSDVEIGLRGEADRDEELLDRGPVVTVMGHVDHGKTSLLDALRFTDVASREAGGITQHIGAYQVKLESGANITFIDTPGHEAFTEMRARGANVTDIVVLVVAADDGIMPQTVEAIRHAKAAGVPIVVAINKIDKPSANVAKVHNELLQHELVVEALGGDVIAIEVSAKARTNLDKLEEAILLQAEILELKANPNRPAEGIIVEAKLDRGRGPVATCLIQRGTLRVGDIFVAGSEWGRVRALVNDKGEQVKEAGPSVPVEVLGLQGTPMAGDEMVVVDSDARARDVVQYRQQRRRDADAKRGARGTVEQMLSQIAAGEAKELPIVIKSDVQGSLEAIIASIGRLSTPEVTTRILSSGVGAISESDVTLARASGAMIIAFNVRANAQARELARRDNVEIRYYSIIYNVVDDVKAALSGMLAPEMRENFLGYAEIREVFQLTKSGSVAGCMITEGLVKRGNKVRLLRDNVVIHEGTLKTLRRFKDEVKEVKQGFECGMAFDNYNDLKIGDMIECFEIVEEARSL